MVYFQPPTQSPWAARSADTHHLLVFCLAVRVYYKRMEVETSPHVIESTQVLDSGFQPSGFRIPTSWITVSNHLHSRLPPCGSQKLIKIPTSLFLLIFVALWLAIYLLFCNGSGKRKHISQSVLYRSQWSITLVELLWGSRRILPRILRNDSNPNHFL